MYLGPGYRGQPPGLLRDGVSIVGPLRAGVSMHGPMRAGVSMQSRMVGPVPPPRDGKVVCVISGAKVTTCWSVVSLYYHLYDTELEHHT